LGVVDISLPFACTRKDRLIHVAAAVLIVAGLALIRVH
jgi:hypothetical protein